MKPLKSFVWRYFEREGGTTAKCKLCKKNVVNHGNTTNLKYHLQKAHSTDEDVLKLDLRRRRSKDDLIREFQKRELDLEDAELHSHAVDNSTDRENWEYNQNELVIEETTPELTKSPNYEEKDVRNMTGDERSGANHFAEFPESTVTRIAQPNSDDYCQIFGSFIAAEMRNLRSPVLQKKFKRKVLQALLDVSADDDVYVNDEAISGR